MPGSHAPKSSASFLTSLARAGAGAIAAVGLVVIIVLIAVNSRSDNPDPSIAGVSPSPTPSATKRTSTPGPTPTPTETQTTEPASEPMIPKDKLRIEVLNGNGREGAAGEVADRMLAAGYARVTATNTALVARTTIYYRGSLRREAERLLREFPEFERIREATTSTPGSARITVVLGADHEPPA